MEDTIERQLDDMIWSWCNKNRPDIAIASKWYEKDGVYERLQELYKAMRGEK